MILRTVISARLHLRVPSLLSAALFSFLLLSPLPPARAQDTGWWFGNASPYPQRALRTHRRVHAKRSPEANDTADSRPKGKGAPAETKPTGPLFAILSLSEQHISIYNSSGLVTRSKVSTGMPGHRTPMGIYTIIGRERYHASNIYSGAPMPFMQRITWSGVAMHLGVVPGYPASHGCVRLPSSSAERLWGLTKIGERVVISPREITPSSISHPMLPLPKMRPSPGSVAEAAPAKVIEIAAAGSEPVPPVGPKLLNPLEYAQALKIRAAADAAAATKTLQEHSQRKEPSPSEGIRKALTELRAAEATRTQAEAKLAVRIEASATKRDAHDIQRAEAAKTTAEANLAGANKKVQAAVENPTFMTLAGREALEGERELIAIRSTLVKAQAAAKEAERRLSPVSILVSKKDKKVYIRQALAPVFEAPATIRDPEKPLGTHVYIATSSSGDSLGWSVVSFPSWSKGADHTSSRRHHTARGEAAPTAESAPTPSAVQALERVEFPADVSARISERLWTGGSLVITDESLSDETSDVGTDLVVTVR